MNYHEAMEYINDTAKFGSNLGLSRTEKLLEHLGNPHKKLKCVHIAGTNGKGSITVMLSTMLKEAGYKVGMYTSPYLEEFEERIQIDGVNIPKPDLAEAVTQVAEAVDKVLKEGYDNPTEFEIITCAMFYYFYKMKVDYAVIEVGLGGRLDSTNVLTSGNGFGTLVSVIASVSYDHMKILGNTLGEIAHEKAGIIKENIPLVLYPQEPEAGQVIEETALKMNSKIINVNKNSVAYENELNPMNSDFTQSIVVKSNKDTYHIKLSLLGQHQLLNCATAIYAAEQLIEAGAVKLKKSSIESALSKVKWPGRLEVMSKEPFIVIDGAHNIDGITKLTDSVKKYFKYNKMILILGILADKQIDAMIGQIAPMADKIITVSPHSSRAESSDKLKDAILNYNRNCENIDDYEKALKKAVSYMQKGDLLLISGSLYMIGDMRKTIKRSV